MKHTYIMDCEHKSDIHLPGWIFQESMLFSSSHAWW